MPWNERELKEIYLNIYYTTMLHHGTSGHNERMLMGRLSMSQGFSIDPLSAKLFLDTDIVLDLGDEK